jgi:hypothetical protein
MSRAQALALAQKKRQSKPDKPRERRSSHRSARINNAGPETLAVKVSRRLDSVKQRLMMRLGLYGQIEEFSLGMFIDVLV